MGRRAGSGGPLSCRRIRVNSRIIACVKCLSTDLKSGAPVSDPQVEYADLSSGGWFRLGVTGRLIARSGRGTLPIDLIGGGMHVEYDLVGADAVSEVAPRLSTIYGAAFSAPPYRILSSQVDAFRAALRRHRYRSGFRLALARRDEVVLGFAYGYDGAAGQWWRDQIYAAVGQRVRQYWLTDYFELAEFAVTPAVQGNGIGGRLHDLLLKDLPNPTAALSTRQVETNALRLYRRRGWVDLLQNYVFTGGIDPYLIMGLDLQSAPQRPIIQKREGME
jgi:ribosomal protein S18 acetylase RimI-like enzyme